MYHGLNVHKIRTSLPDAKIPIEVDKLEIASQKGTHPIVPGVAIRILLETWKRESYWKEQYVGYSEQF